MAAAAADHDDSLALINMEPVNHFNIKRAAHALSRRGTGSGDRWNIFRHLSWDRPTSPADGRNNTWDVEAAAAQRRADPDDVRGTEGAPVNHVKSAPTTWNRNSPPDTGIAGRLEKEEGGSSSQRDHDIAGKDKELTDPKRDEAASQPYSGDTIVDSQTQQSTVSDDADGPRQRRPTDKTGNSGSQDDADDQTRDDDDPSKKKKEGKKSMFRTVHPKTPFTFANQIQRTFLNSWINILLLAAPIGIILGALPNMNKIAVFVINFIAIIPLAAMLSFATEEIALRTGETIGGLLNATFGNAVELIVAIMALVQNKIIIVQTSLIGSILSNLLLVMGMCFFCGGWRREVQMFNEIVANTAVSLLSLAVGSIIVPTAFDQITNLDVGATASLSRGTAVILLFVYAGYLYFQLRTHHEVFAREGEKMPKKPRRHDLPDGAITKGFVMPAVFLSQVAQSKEGNKRKADDFNAANPDRFVRDDGGDGAEHDDPQLHLAVALGVLAGSTVIIAFCAEFLVDSINAVVAGGSVSEEFIGLILLPIVGNAAEHATAVTVAIKDKMDLAIGVAVGSSMQVALFLIPLLVVIGWGMGNEAMNLSFDLFQVIVLFVAVLLVNYLISDGKSHWLEGLQLMCLYLIIAVCSWWYPAKGLT